MGEDDDLKNGPVVIQERIEKAMSEEFEKLLEEKKQDRLLVSQQFNFQTIYINL